MHLEGTTGGPCVGKEDREARVEVELSSKITLFTFQRAPEALAVPRLAEMRLWYRHVVGRAEGNQKFWRAPLRQGLVVAVCYCPSEVKTGGLRGALPASFGRKRGKTGRELAGLRVHAALRPPLGGPLRCGRRLM